MLVTYSVRFGKVSYDEFYDCETILETLDPSYFGFIDVNNEYHCLHIDAYHFVKIGGDLC